MTFEKIQRTWMNGRFASWAESHAPMATHALHYGTGVFEGIRNCAVRGEPAILRI
jgi:branched-chain amino acid aminotransferase